MDTLFPVLLPLILLGAAIGILIVGLLTFIYIWLQERQPIQLAVTLFCLCGLFFVSGEMGVLVAWVLRDPVLGRSLHRFQALSVIPFICILPFLASHLLLLNRRWHRFNRLLSRIALVAMGALLLLILIMPEQFVSLEKHAQGLNLHWSLVRGRTGPLYLVRDVLLIITILYVFVFLVFDLIRYRRYRYLLFPLAGLLVAIIFTMYDLLYIYHGIEISFLPHKISSYSSLGISAFIICSVIGVIRMLADEAREVQKARKLHSLGMLAGGIAHDFNNLLTAILGNLSLLKAPNLGHEEILEGLNAAEKASLRAREMTRRLLMFSRDGTPIMEVEAIEAILHETVRFILSGANVKCNFYIANDLYKATVDRSQISQVFQNLALNAIQAMPNGGTLTINGSNSDTMPQTNGRLQKGRFVHIAFQDTGKGIAKKDLDHIFDPYFSTKQFGNGLGLAVCSSVVEKHGGHICASSKPGEGSLFELWLPAAEGPLRDSAPPWEGTPEQQARVLVLDDEPMIRDMARHMLEKLGHQVDTVSSGEEAIAACRQATDRGRPYTCLLLDLTIPGAMGGKEALQHIHIFAPGTSAIVSSGYYTDPVLANYQDYGFGAALAKPYSFQDLQEALARVLSPPG